MKEGRTENSTLPTSLDPNIEVETQLQALSPEIADSNLSFRSMEVSCQGGMSALANGTRELVERSEKTEEEQAAESFNDSESGHESIYFESAEIIHCTISETSKHDNTKTVNEFARSTTVLDTVRSGLESKDAEIVGLKASAMGMEDDIRNWDNFLRACMEELSQLKALNLKLEAEKKELQAESETQRRNVTFTQRVFREKTEELDNKNRDLQAENDKLKLDVGFSHRLLREKTKEWDDLHERLDAREKSSNENFLRLRTENEKLKAEKKEFQEEIENLKSDLSVSQNTLTTNRKELEQPRERMKVQEPLFNVGVAVRRKFIERSKQDFTNGKFVNVRGTANEAVIEAGNRAAHHAELLLIPLSLYFD